MRSDPQSKGRSLQGQSDLTLVAPIRPGLVNTQDTRTYRSRVRLLLRTLSALRASAAEYAPLRPLSDTAARVQAIQSVRLAVVEPDQLLLAVTFDGAWETYIEVLWRKVHTLLDVIFCNTEGYVSGHDHGYAEWARWVRSVQVPTDFLYTASALTVDDLHYVRSVDQLDPADPQAALKAAGVRVRRPEELAAAVRDADRGGLETVRQGLQALALVHRLGDLYPPGTEDGGFLLRATHDLLSEFDTRRLIPPGPIRDRFAAQLDWFEQDRQPPRRAPATTPPPAAAIQAGIVGPYAERTTHGALLLFAVNAPDPRGRRAAAAFLRELAPRTTTQGLRPADGLHLNVAVTVEGLHRLGVADDELAALPQEFREGMEARAGLLGDLRCNHPRNWTLPERNWPVAGAAAPRAGTRVPLSMVHLVVQLRRRHVPAATGDHEIAGNPAHPLYADVAALAAARPGVTLLSVQAMFSPAGADGSDFRGHFGYVNGISQPRVVAPQADPAAPPRPLYGDAAAPASPPPLHWDDAVPLGDLLLGHGSSFDIDTAAGELLRDGSFLVVRKLRQDVALFESVLAQAGADAAARDDLKARLMGRSADGVPLVPGAGPAQPGAAQSNDFHYGDDAAGAACPMQSHVRRSNPRTDPGAAGPHGPAPRGDRRPPRIARRGMSYGPPRAVPAGSGLAGAGTTGGGRAGGSAAGAGTTGADGAGAGTAGAGAAGDDGTDRGVVFLACNASIAQQFEVVQRWVAGGNASGGFSGHADPFLGVPTAGEERTFRWWDGSAQRRVRLDTPERRPMVRLEWGAYLFMPSMAALARLADTAEGAAAAAPPVPWSADAGEAAVQRLLALDRQLGAAAAASWKAALEDTSDRSRPLAASIWAALRERHGGVLRTSYGVLACGADRVDEVLGDNRGRYSVRGYAERARGTLGEIYLGLDDTGPGCDYRLQSARANPVLLGLREAEAFATAFAVARGVLAAYAAGFTDLARRAGQREWEAAVEIAELSDRVLAELCRRWFDVPDGTRLKEGGARWDWTPAQPPLCPGHFTAPSRHLFQPAPGAAVAAAARAQGQALRAAMNRLVADWRAVGGTPPRGRLSRPIFDAFADPAEDDLLARTLAGVLMGFLPTTDGNLRATLGGWLADRTLWDVQHAYEAHPAAETPHERALAAIAAPLRRAMQARPVPELVWRTAALPHRLGEVEVRAGDTVVVAIVSATQQRLAEDDEGADIHAVFGGDRRAGVHPTHACPAQEVGFGVLLGCLAALVSHGPLRWHPAPLTVNLTGVVPPASTVTAGDAPPRAAGTAATVPDGGTASPAAAPADPEQQEPAPAAMTVADAP